MRTGTRSVKKGVSRMKRISDIEQEMEKEIEEDDIYRKDARELLLEEDELSLFEEAFMRGYEEAS